MRDIKNLRVAAIATDGVEEPELLEPAKALEQAGASVELLSLKAGPVQCFQHHDKGSTVQATKAIEDVSPDDYDALLLPGGALNADALRIDTSVKHFVCAFDEEKKPMAVICHAPWILISAGVAKDRTLTGYKTIEDDIRNAGAHWVDREVCTDFNWVTSRQPGDLPAFIPAMIETFADFAKKTQHA